jgi:hypothetical protein
MKVAKNLLFKIEIEIEIIEIHAILKSKLKLKYSKQSKFKSNWPHISVIEIAIEIEIHFKIEITLRAPFFIRDSVRLPKHKLRSHTSSVKNCSRTSSRVDRCVDVHLKDSIFSYRVLR